MWISVISGDWRFILYSCQTKGTVARKTVWNNEEKEKKFSSLPSTVFLLFQIHKNYTEFHN